MPSGPRSRPPDLPNFQYETWLGGGGFADVFLYRQVRPARQVAIKVLRTDGLDAETQRAFDAEADLMARVSEHPYIVTIFGADVAPDGRPYLVMEYYPKPHYGRRLREEMLSVPEVLRTGVRVASAVETAHRAGILHRDIKPANILVNDYDRPGLTDFGIAGAREGSVVAEAQGVTVAYAPPEVLLDQQPGDERADVYALGATLYALLAGRAPFEERGGDNSAQALLRRTLNGTVPPIGRTDVPSSIELLLSHAMSKDPASRPSSAATFARSLQGIEQELRLAPTEFELKGADSLTKVSRPDDDEATRGGRIQVVQQPGHGVISRIPAGGELGTASAAPSESLGAMRIPDAPPTADTVARPAAVAAPAPSGSGGDASSAVRRTPLLVGAAAAVLVVVLVAVVLLSRGGSSQSAATTTTIDESALVVPDTPSVPVNVKIVVNNGVATITWDHADTQDGDKFVVKRVDGAHSGDGPIETEATQLDVTGIAEGEHPCFQISAVRGSRQSDPSAVLCAT